jgi:hypothetical protein
LETFEITLICKQECSNLIPAILREVQSENNKFEFAIKDSSSFGPVTNEIIFTVIIKAAADKIISILTALFKKTSEKDIRTEYRDRRKLSRAMLSEKGPLITEEEIDTPYYSKYVYITKLGKFVWEYNKGDVSIRKLE